MLEAERLISAVRQRDESALGRLYSGYGGLVYALALRVTGDPGLAEEVSLDVFWQAWQQAERFDAAQGSVQAWLCNMARSRAIDRLRAQSATKRTHAEDWSSETDSEGPDVMTELRQRRSLVRKAMEELKPAHRHALELAYFEGLSHSQIAARLNEPLGTVKTRIRQAMEVLRRALGPTLSPS